MKNKAKLISYSIASAVSLAVSAGVGQVRGLFGAADVKSAMFALSDSFFVPSVLFIGMGLLLLISGEGVFDILIYGIRNLGRLFTPFEKSGTKGKFYDFKAELAEKRAKRGSTLFILITGVADLFLALLFYCIYLNIR